MVLVGIVLAPSGAFQGHDGNELPHLVFRELP